MRFRRFALSLIVVHLLVLSSAFFAIPAVQAYTDVSVTAPDLGTDYVAASGLSNADPRILVAKIIRAAMGLLGIVAVVIVVIAGFDWMTAGGNDEKVGTAKKWLTTGIIGLIIILGAYSISNFVVKQLVNVTTAGDSSINP